ncbi:MAG: polymorphic toxin-type HINT domain-containing protein, partial [Tepidisphaeraceae bacterium]
DGNVETIQTTDEHPFWVEGIGWVRAGELRVGMEVDQPDGSNATVISTVYEAHPEGIADYNFEVTGDHTYFVEDGQGGQTAVWVHNQCARRLWRNMQKAGFAAAKKAGQAVHHIIARNEMRWDAPAVRDHFNKVLAGAEEGLDEFFNGVVLDAAYHAKLNSKEYYDAVLKRVKQWDTPLDLIQEMIKIGDELANKTFKF